MNNFWNNKNVLVTGHTGFKGSWISLYLKFLGANVYGLSSSELDGVYKLANVSSIISNECFIDLSIHNQEKKILSFMEEINPDIVFHFAAQSLVLESYRNPRKTLDTNIMGTFNLIESVNNSSVNPKIVIATTDKVYKHPDNLNNEQSELGGKDFYSISKVSKELLVEAILNHPEFKNLTISRVRSGNVIGGGERREDRLFTDLITSYIKNENYILRNPFAIRPWQYILDSLTGYLLVGKKTLESNESLIYNLNSEINNKYNVEQIANLFLKHSNGANKIIIDENSIYSEVSKLVINSTKADNELGWIAKAELDMIVKNIIDWETHHLNNSGPEYSFSEIENFLNI